MAGSVLMPEGSAEVARKPRKKRLTKDLIGRGWIPGVYDICWLACDRPGHLHAPHLGMEICLCVEHIKEMEETSYSGYEFANPPEGYDDKVWWPWQEIEAAE